MRPTRSAGPRHEACGGGTLCWHQVAAAALYNRDRFVSFDPTPSFEFYFPLLPTRIGGEKNGKTLENKYLYNKRNRAATGF